METPHEEVPVTPRPLGATEAKQLGSAARDRLFRQADAGKVKVAETLKKLVDSLEELGDGKELPGQAFLGSAAGKLRSFQGTLRDTPTEELYQKAEQLVRDRPGVFLAGCFAIGFLGLRMLKG